MEMQQVRYFLTLARTLNFTRAAEECNVSQPSLTRAIRLLEEELGGELLRRERQQSHLTELGMRMLPLMKQCYESALTAKSLAKAIKTSVVAPLSIAVSHSVNIDLLLPPLREISRVYPGLQLKVRRGSADTIASLLKEGEVELAVAGQLDESWERLDRWPILDETFLLALHPEHMLSTREAVEMSDLAQERLLINIACETGKRLAERLGEHRPPEASAYEIESEADLVALLEANLGVAVLPKTTPAPALLRRMPIRDIELNRTIAVYGVAGRRRSAAASTLLNLLRAADWTRYLN
jgi:DNA-binding transcriptional LysR family regulator